MPFEHALVSLDGAGRHGCGIRVHTVPQSLATSTAATRS